MRPGAFAVLIDASENRSTWGKNLLLLMPVNHISADAEMYDGKLSENHSFLALPTYSAFMISVRQAGDLPPASFRFPVTRDTLAPPISFPLSEGLGTFIL